MRKFPVYRLGAVLLLVTCFLSCIPVATVHANISPAYRSLVNVVIPIEDDIDPKPEEEVSFRLFSDETTDPYMQIRADTAWNYETYGNEVNVAVIDTGCAVHPALAETLKKNYYFQKITDENGSINYKMMGTDKSTDTHGHGTHVAGIIAAQLGNSLNVKGIAPKVNLYTFNCSVTTEEGARGINFGLALYAMEYAVQALGCKVINMSFGAAESKLGSEALQALHNGIRAAADAGTLLIAAAGNDGDATRNYPAAFDEVIGVGSVNSHNVRSGFSVTNDTVDVVAPGGDSRSRGGTSTEWIRSLGLNTETTASKSGTSQAAPHVTGAAALMLSVNPSLKPSDFKTLLQNCSAKIHGEGYDATDGYGNGLLDVCAMFTALTQGKDCYIAPPAENHISLFNMTDKELKAQTVLAFFSDQGVLKSCTFQDVTIGAQAATPLSYGKSAAVQRLFVWHDNTMKALAAARQVH